MGRIVINDFKSNGTLTAAEHKSQFGNAEISINAPSADVLIKNSTFNQDGYNCIEIGLTANIEPPKNVVIENCDFSATYTNNAILVFGTQDNAVISISNCHFKSVSNMLRLSNRTNAKNVTVLITDCTVDKWDSDPKYAGCIILEDYTSKNMEEFTESSRFSKDKLSIHVKNLVHAGKRVAPDEVIPLINCNNPNQLAYIYIDNVPASYRYPEYDPEIFPEIEFK